MYVFNRSSWFSLVSSFSSLSLFTWFSFPDQALKPRTHFLLPLASVAVRKYGVGKLIMSTSPSTRFDGNDIDGLKEDELAMPKKFLQVGVSVQGQLVLCALAIAPCPDTTYFFYIPSSVQARRRTRDTKIVCSECTAHILI